MFHLLIGTVGAFEVLENSHGRELAWDQMPVPYMVDTRDTMGLDPDEIHAAIDQAIRTWEEAGTTSVRFEAQGEPQSATTEHDYENVVYFTHDWPHDPSLLALTSTWSTADGTIVGFDMAINANQPWSLDGTPGTYDLQNMLAHEFGHVLGLGHTDDDLYATMHATSVQGELSKRDLTEDDRDGLAYQYGGLESSQPVGCSSVPPVGVAALFGLAVLGRRRQA